MKSTIFVFEAGVALLELPAVLLLVREIRRELGGNTLGGPVTPALRKAQAPSSGQGWSRRRAPVVGSRLLVMFKRVSVGPW